MRVSWLDNGVKCCLFMMPVASLLQHIARMKVTYRCLA